MKAVFTALARHLPHPSALTRPLFPRAPVWAAAFLGISTWLPAAEPGKLTVTWLQMPVHGLAVLIETPSGRAGLIDTGGTQRTEAKDYDAGRDTIAPFLRSKGHTEIAWILVSHPHGDHFGGASWLIDNLRVGRFIDHAYEGRGQSLGYTRLRQQAQRRGGEYRAVHAGDRLDLDPALAVEVVSPPAEFLSKDADPAKITEHGLLNMNSIVLRVQHGKNVFLFPGDCYGGGFERYLREKVAPEKLRTTVLTAPHHGFNPGIEFPKMTSPRYVVVSCLADYPANANTPNPRSPGDRALEVFGKVGAKTFVTAWNGNVRAVSDGDTVAMTSQRERADLPGK